MPRRLPPVSHPARHRGLGYVPARYGITPVPVKEGA